MALPAHITTQPFKAIEGIAAAAVGLGAAGAAGHAIWHDTHLGPGEEPQFTKGKLAALMGASVATTAVLMGASKWGALDALARVADDARRPALARTGAASLSGAALGAATAAIPGSLLATGWGWIALVAPD